ncbi:cytochrome oxidase putative small subunit CydP [Rhodanobacter ginsengisoli]|uniref:Cytochrome oxidase putative small subunit CydP n=1 Tax=Rhodanobacter ginsengisoli TaxID=418646 RepID=A0ABW0QI27_9GAMM
MPSSAVYVSSPANSSTPSRPLRRLTLELFGLIALKLELLMLIWWVAFAPHARPDVSPAMVADRLAPASPALPEHRP